MKIAQINQVCNASTGKIMIAISDLLTANHIENYMLYTTGNCNKENAIKYGSNFDTKLSAVMAKTFGNYGFNSFYNTRCLIKELDKIKPDIIHLHNVHGHNVNLGKLFKYIKENKIKTLWTFHDCWPFTGYCTYFDYVRCDKWKTECKNCIQRKTFSLFFDKSNKLFRRKKELTDNVPLSIVAPSKWTARVAKESFYKDYPITVIGSGINLDVFKPTKSDFKKRYGIEDKKMLLGVAIGFEERKGYSYYLKLSKIIDDDTVIVMVGVSKEQIAELPDNIIGIERTQNQTELAEIYTAADAFINCTMEEVLGLVNLEALACGTPMVTFNTGGSVEPATGGVGAVVEQGDIEGMYREAKRLMNLENISEKCRAAAVGKYDEKKCYIDYIELYKNI